MKDLVPRALARIERASLLGRKRIVQGTWRRRGDQARTVVFVGGVQRSGTNMVMEILEQCLETDVVHERDPRAYRDYQMRPRAVLRSLVDASPAPVVAFKALMELQDLSSLLDEFAPAKALWPVRCYEDTVNSHLRHFSGCRQRLARIVGGAADDDWRAGGMSDATRALIGRYVTADINDASAVALFWYFRNALFFEQKLDKDGRVLPLRYEALATEPEQEFRRVFDFLGLEFSPRFTRKIFASSVGKHASPNIDPAIRKLCASMMMRFEALLARSPPGRGGSHRTGRHQP